MLSSVHGHTHSEAVQDLALNMVLLSPLCEAAKLGLCKDSQESHTSKILIVPPTASACVLTSTATLGFAETSP